MTAFTITHLILGSGGLSCLCYLGLLKYLQEHDLHVGIRHYYGVSMGAFFGFLFALGLPHEQIFEAIAEFLCNPENTYSPIPSFADLQHRHGLVAGSMMTAPLKNIYQRFYNESFPKQSYNIDNLTFLEFTKHTGVILTVVATNVLTEQPQFFSVETTPNVCVWDAIQASMTIPFVFLPCKIDHGLYVDGVLTCEFPVPANQLAKLPLESTLGVFLDTRKKQTETTVSSAGLDMLTPISLWDYTLRILQLQLFYTKEVFSQTKQLKHVLWLSSPPTSLLPINIQNNGLVIDLSLHELEEADRYGYYETQTYFTIAGTLGTAGAHDITNPSYSPPTKSAITK